MQKSRFYQAIFRSLFQYCWLIVMLLPLIARGQSKPFIHPLFTSNMVLQRNATVPVWGWAAPGASVAVAIAGQSLNATANANGRWQVNLGPVNAGGPYTLAITGSQTETFTNVLFGDVYLCSGQSNMEWSVNSAYNSAAEISDSANYPNVRCFTVPKVPAFEPQETIGGGSWRVAGTSTTGNFSATAYFMAREIYKQQNVPIGVVVAAWGGTQIQSWVDLETSQSFADTSQSLFDQRAGTPNADTISGHFNGLIHPLVPFAFKAAVWYQGEFNAGRGQQYSRLLPSLLSGWRSRFGANLPFLIVQLPNNDAKQTQPVETGGWAEIREAQDLSVKADLGRSRIINTIDIGEGQLHPLNKQDVGLRLSWAAANLLYSQNVVSQGPLFQQAAIVPNQPKMVCTFSNTGGGLMIGSKNAAVPLAPVQQDTTSALKGFSIAGPDHIFYAATATITGPTTVEVSSASVPAPQFVRYAWANNPDCNLYNKIINGGGTVINGLPAGSFRNDPVYKLNVNAGGGGRETYIPGTQSSIAASVPAGQTFHHWGGDVAALSGPSNPATATLSNRYVSLRAYFQINSAPAISASAQVGRNVIEWSPMTGVHYRLKRAASSGGPFQTIADNIYGVNRYIDTTIGDSANYYYTVSAFNEVNEGPASTPVGLATIPYVRNVQAQPGAALVNLSWSSFPGALSYDIGRSVVAGGSYEIIARSVSATSYVDRSLTAGNSYHYVVAANLSGTITTALSPEVAAQPEFLPVPLKNQDIGGVGIAGVASVDTSGNLVIKASGADIAGITDEFHFAHVSLTGDGVLTARVASLDSPHVFAKAGVMMRSALSGDSPYAFALFYGNQTNAGNQFRLTSGASQVSTGGANANRWLRVARAGNTFTTYSSADGQSWSQMGAAQTIVMPATIYAGLAFTSHNDARLDSAIFSNVSGINLQASIPPQSLVASVRSADGAVVLNWAATAGAGGYKVKRSSVSGGPFTTVADGVLNPNYVPNNLTAGTTYYYVVSAITGTGETANSTAVQVAVPSLGTFPSPTGLTATAGNGEIRLDWSGPSTATGYKVKRAAQPAGPYVTIQETSTTQFVDAALTNGITYYYVVAAKGSAGDSTDSLRVSVAPRFASKNGALRAVVNSRYVSAVGSAAIIANKDLIGATELFDLIDLGSNQIALRSSASGNYITAPNGGANSLAATQSNIGTAERFTITYLANGGLNLKALVNDRFVAAEGGGSQPLIANRLTAGSYETFEFVPAADLKTPGAFVAIPGNNAVSLSWSAVAGATSYRIQRSITGGSGYVNLASPTGTKWTDATAVNGTVYYYLISPVSGLGASPVSAEVAAKPDSTLLGALDRSGWIASGSSATGTQSAAAAIDGNDATRWTSGALQQPGQWFQVDMGSLRTFSQIILDAGTSAADYPRGYEVRVSNDGVNWGNPVAVGSGGSAITIIQFSQQNARYIQVTQTGNTGPWWSIHEFNVLSSGSASLLPSPWLAEDIGSVGNAGGSSYVNSTFTVTGSGSDIWGTTDAFHYVRQSSSGDCSIVAKVTSVENTNGWAKAGVMIRETSGASSPHAGVFVTPGAGISFQYRATTGGACTFTSTGGAAPQWVKLSRSGNSFSAYRSVDGLAWIQVGTTQTISMASSATFGLAVTSHDNTKLCGAVMEQVTAVP